jgi:hypothetical protein
MGQLPKFLMHRFLTKIFDVPPFEERPDFGKKSPVRLFLPSYNRAEGINYVFYKTAILSLALSVFFSANYWFSYFQGVKFDYGVFRIDVPKNQAVSYFSEHYSETIFLILPILLLYFYINIFLNYNRISSFIIGGLILNSIRNIYFRKSDRTLKSFVRGYKGLIFCYSGGSVFFSILGYYGPGIIYKYFYKMNLGNMFHDFRSQNLANMFAFNVCDLFFVHFMMLGVIVGLNVLIECAFFKERMLRNINHL